MCGGALEDFGGSWFESLISLDEGITTGDLDSLHPDLRLTLHPHAFLGRRIPRRDGCKNLDLCVGGEGGCL